MKNTYKLSFLFSLLVLLFSSCIDDADKQAYVMEGMDMGGVMPSVTFSTSKIFDVADINNTSIKFKLKVAAVGEYGVYRQVVISKSFNGSDPIIHMTVPAAEIPKDIEITVADALQGFDVEISEINGGDFIDWTFEVEFDDPDFKFNDDALTEAFPDFTAFFASTPDFEVAQHYTIELIDGTFGFENQVTEGVEFSLVPGTANSQYVLAEASAGAFPNYFSVDLAYRFFYIGNNQFALNATSEPWSFVALAGTVTRDPGTGIITVNAYYVGWILDGVICHYRMIPE